MKVSDEPGWQSRAALNPADSAHICSDSVLQARLNRALNGEHLRIVDREPSKFASSFMAEVLTCEKHNGERLKLWCKHELMTRAADNARGFMGYRMGIRYEAYIYRCVLRPYAVTTPRFLGLDSDPASDTASLFLEYVDTNSRRISEAQLPSAVAWIARFHANHMTSWPDQLKRRTREFFAIIGTQTPLFSSILINQFPWLSGLQTNSGRWITHLMTAEQTIIHGEYYPQNLLLQGQRVCPVDWESAAISVGEIDLAALTLDWSKATSAACEQHYAAARWPAGAPSAFHATLDSARLFIRLWNLAQIDPTRPSERQLMRIAELEAHAKQMNLL